MVEIFFRLITRQSIRRGSFSSVSDLEETMRAYIDNYNQFARPFRWVKTADYLLGQTKQIR